MQARPEWAKQARWLLPRLMQPPAVHTPVLPEAVFRLRQSLGQCGYSGVDLETNGMRDSIRDELIGLTRQVIQLQFQSRFALLEFKASATGQPTSDKPAA